MIGVMRLPSLAAALTAAGYTVITADDYKATATNIRAATDEFGSFPIFVADSKWPGLRAWATRFSHETTVVVVRTVTGDGVDFADDSVIEAFVPMTLAELLALANRAVHPSFAAFKVDERGTVDGFVGDYAEPEPAPPAPPAPPTPVEEHPYVPVTAPQPEPVVDDPWGDQPPAVDPVFVAPPVQPAPEPVDDPVFEVPSDPEPVFVAPPVEDDSETSPAADPVFTAPAAGEHHSDEDPWGDEPAPETPVFVAPPVEPDPESEPVFTAPPVEAEPVGEDPWVEPVPETPVFVAPAVDEPEPDKVPVFTAPTGEEVQPEPAPTVAPSPVEPVFTAPPLQPVDETEPEPDEDVFAAIATQQLHEARDSGVSTDGPYVQSPGGELVPVSRTGHLVTGSPDQGQGQVVVSWAAKGGTGKTSASCSLAQHAAERGLRVILIDANMGQGDIRTYLRIGMASLPSVYNYAVTGDIRQTLISPVTLTEARDLKQTPLRFGLITAPPAHLADESVVTPEVYMRLVADARAMCDLVVIDTQIVEAKDSSGMVDRFLLPLLASGAWGMCSTDVSSSGVTNTLSRLKKFAAHGVPRERQLSFLNRVPNNLSFYQDGLAAAISEHSVFLGVCYADTAIPERQNAGGLPVEVPQFAKFMGAVLGNVFPGLQVPEQIQEEQDQPSRRRRRLFGLGGRG